MGKGPIRFYKIINNTIRGDLVDSDGIIKTREDGTTSLATNFSNTLVWGYSMFQAPWNNPWALPYRVWYVAEVHVHPKRKVLFSYNATKIGEASWQVMTAEEAYKKSKGAFTSEVRVLGEVKIYKVSKVLAHEGLLVGEAYMNTLPGGVFGDDDPIGTDRDVYKAVRKVKVYPATLTEAKKCWATPATDLDFKGLEFNSKALMESSDVSPFDNLLAKLVFKGTTSRDSFIESLEVLARGGLFHIDGVALGFMRGRPYPSLDVFHEDLKCVIDALESKLFYTEDLEKVLMGNRDDIGPKIVAAVNDYLFGRDIYNLANKVVNIITDMFKPYHGDDSLSVPFSNTGSFVVDPKFKKGTLIKVGDNYFTTQDLGVTYSNPKYLVSRVRINPSAEHTILGDRVVKTADLIEILDR